MGPEIDLDRREGIRLREVIERLRDEDVRQNHRLQDIEDAVAVLRADIAGVWKSYTRLETALIGHDGNNGIRGTMQEQYVTTNGRLEKLESKIDGVTDSVNSLTLDFAKLASSMATAMKVISGVAASTGVVWVIIQIADYFN